MGIDFAKSAHGTRLNLNDVDRVTIGTGHTDKAVILSLPVPVTLIMLTPKEARVLAARILELADHVDGGEGLS